MFLVSSHPVPRSPFRSEIDHFRWFVASSTVPDTLLPPSPSFLILSCSIDVQVVLVLPPEIPLDLLFDSYPDFQSHNPFLAYQTHLLLFPTMDMYSTDSQLDSLLLSDSSEVLLYEYSPSSISILFLPLYSSPDLIVSLRNGSLLTDDEPLLSSH